VSYASLSGKPHAVVSVYPWPCLLLLELELDMSNHAQALVRVANHTRIELPATPMCVTIAQTQMTASSSSSSSSAYPSIFLVDESLHVRQYVHSSSGWSVVDNKTSAALSSLNAPFAPVQASVSETLISHANASSFVGSGPKDAQDQVNLGPNARYISPFSSTQQAAHQMTKLNLLNAAGFTFRRFFDKIQREAFVQAKKVESQSRKVAQKIEAQKKKEEERKKKEEEMAE
jgi:hypothetical protein